MKPKQIEIAEKVLAYYLLLTDNDDGSVTRNVGNLVGDMIHLTYDKAISFSNIMTCAKHKFNKEKKIHE